MSLAARIPMRSRPPKMVVFGCPPDNESDFCPRCGASFTVGLPFYTEKQKREIRARLHREWMDGAIQRAHKTTEKQSDDR